VDEEDFDDQADEETDENDIDELSDEFPSDARFTTHQLIQVCFQAFLRFNTMVLTNIFLYLRQYLLKSRALMLCHSSLLLKNQDHRWKLR